MSRSTASNIWNAYLGGSGTNRPFGSVQLDGVDLDVEMANGAQYYSDFVNALKGGTCQGSICHICTPCSIKHSVSCASGPVVLTVLTWDGDAQWATVLLLHYPCPEI